MRDDDGGGMHWVLPMAAVMFAVLGLLSAFAGCGGGAGVKTVNVERITTNTVAVPKAVACFKKAELIQLPTKVVVDAETATEDQLAAAAAADRENFIRYAEAVSAAMAQCAEGSPK